MTRIDRFEDLVAWQRARELTLAIYQITKRGEFARDFGLTRQIQRAAVSIMSNLAEGFERGGRKEFHQYISIAKASCAEVRFLLYVALDAGYVEEEQFTDLMMLGEEVARISGALRAAVARQIHTH